MRRTLYNLKSFFKPDTSDADFISNIIFLDRKDDGTLSDYEEKLYSDIVNNLYSICREQVENNLKNNTYLPNRGETIGEFMYFTKYVNI